MTSAPAVFLTHAEQVAGRQMITVLFSLFFKYSIASIGCARKMSVKGDGDTKQEVCLSQTIKRLYLFSICILYSLHSSLLQCVL